MAQIDRGILKLIALPFFESSFRNVLEILSLCTVERVINVPATTAGQFAEKIMEWAPTLLVNLPPAELGQALGQIAKSFDQFELFWTLVTEAKELLLLQEARMAGFGGFVARDLARPNPMAKSSALLSIPNLALPGPMRKKEDLPPGSQSTQLLKSELLAKDKWIRRLEAIAQRAGSSARINDDAKDRSVLSLDEADLLRKISLAKGAFRTLAVHIRHFERLQQFTKDKALTIGSISVDGRPSPEVCSVVVQQKLRSISDPIGSSGDQLGWEADQDRSAGSGRPSAPCPRREVH